MVELSWTDILGRSNLGCGLAPSHKSLGRSVNGSSRFGKPHFRYIPKHLISGGVWRAKKGPSAVHTTDLKWGKIRTGNDKSFATLCIEPSTVDEGLELDQGGIFQTKLKGQNG